MTKGERCYEAGGARRVRMTHSISLHSWRALINYSHHNDGTKEATHTLLLQTRYFLLKSHLTISFLPTSPLSLHLAHVLSAMPALSVCPPTAPQSACLL